MKAHPRVAWQVIDGQAVLMDLERGRVLGLNDTGSYLWPRLETQNEEELARDLSGAYAVDIGRARQDVADFVGLLRERGFLEE